MASESSKPESIFFAALEQPTAEEQAAYLDQACGQDTKLRRRVEKLLAAEPRVGTFLEEPLTEHPNGSGSTRSQEGPGTVIGPYKLLQEIGEGGFGIVYMAEQLEPVRRQVALKIIKPGMDTREVIARFEAERQALAMMDHSNIARVFDAGATESGRPYFVMELVKGVTITEFCDKNNLETEKRLELFITVCRAVQHAHQKGVIHRDIKPSNIMITLHDGDPVPKVIDFGVSKAISQRLTEKTLFTRYGQMIGTPQYMSPEQAEMSGLDVDTRSDIYSLGVLLYELLTGTTPLEAKRLRTAAYGEMLRMIQDEEPARPSTRLSTLGDSLTIVCEHRKTDPHRLRKLIRGDLDWIVMRALEKHRDRRYETANELAREVRRHLDQEPVVAGPPSATYRLSKLVRRNKVMVAAGACVLIALVMGLAAAALGLAQAVHQRGLAQSSEQVAIEQRHVADKARDEAAKHAQQLERQVSFMHVSNANRAIREKNLVRANIELTKCKGKHRGWEWHALADRVGASMTDSKPGSRQPYFTSDGTRTIAIGHATSRDANTAIVWDVASGSRVTQLTHAHELTSLALSSDDKWLVAGDVNGGLVLWELDTKKTLWQKEARTGWFNALAFSPDRSLIAAANYDQTVQVFARDDGAEKLFLEIPDPVVAPATIGDTQAEAGQQGKFKQKVMFSPDGRWVAVGSFGRSVLMNVDTKKVVSFPSDTKVPTFNPMDGRQIATGNPLERTITLWDWDGEQLRREHTWAGDGSSRFLDLCFHPDGTHLVSAQGKYVSVWNAANRKRVAAITTDGFTYWLAMNHSGNLIACCGDDRIDKLWGGAMGHHLWRYQGQDARLTIRPHERASQFMKFSPNGQRIAIGSHRGQQGLSNQAQESAGPVIILDSKSGDVISRTPSACRGFSWMPDNQRIIVTRDQEKNTHEMYNVVTGEFVCEFDGHFAVGRPYIDKTGRVLTSLGKDSSGAIVVRIWDIESTKLSGDSFVLGKLWGGGNIYPAFGGFWTSSVGPRGQRVAVALGSGFRIWDTNTREETPQLPTEGRTEETLAFTDDGNYIYTTTGKKFSLFDVGQNRLTTEFVGPTGTVVISPDNRQIVSCGDGVVVWDVEFGIPVITLSDEDGFVSVDWSPDNRLIAAGQNDGTVHIWMLPSGP